MLILNLQVSGSVSIARKVPSDWNDDILDKMVSFFLVLQRD